MPTLEAFLQANFIVIYFGCGLIFFLMGFGAAVAVRTFRDSHLALARHLPLLAGFGILEGVAQWGIVFIPQQASYLGSGALAVLLLLQMAIMGLASACLLAFGAGLVTRAGGKKWRQGALWLPAGILAVWLTGFVFFAPGFDLSPELAAWRLSGLRLATYLMALPGAILSAWGVLAQRREMARFYPRAAWFLSGTALAFLLLIPLVVRSMPAAPLLVPEAPRPAHFSPLRGVPVQVFLGLDGLMLAFFTMQALEVFRRENSRRLEQAQRWQAALEERHRIGRELNDAVLQDIMGIGLLLESAQMALTEGAADAAREALDVVHHQQGCTAERLRAFIVELEPMDWQSQDLGEGFRRLVEEFLAHTLVPVDWAVDPAVSVDPATAQHLYMVVQEALTAVRRHGRASRVHLRLTRAGDLVLLSIRQEGKDLPAGPVNGQGAEAMQRAACALAGRLEVAEVPGGGSEVRLWLPDMIP